MFELEVEDEVEVALEEVEVEVEVEIEVVVSDPKSTGLGWPGKLTCSTNRPR